MAPAEEEAPAPNWALVSGTDPPAAAAAGAAAEGTAADSCAGPSAEGESGVAPLELEFSSRAEAKWFAQPRISQLVRRMHALGEHAKAEATTRREKKLLEKFYSNDGLKRRVKLLFEPDIVDALERIWLAADTDGSHTIEKNEYLVMHRKLVLALDPATSPKKAFKAAEEDWMKDSEGKASLDKDRFFWCWFELADLWTDSFDVAAYVQVRMH